MPYGDANAIMLEMASETLTVVKNTPVLAGICGTDPFRDMSRLLREVKNTGFTGVQNFPTVGLIDGVFRQNLEETGMGYEKEVEMIRLAHEMDLLTTPYVFNIDEAKRMAQAGADVIVAHMGLTTRGTIGAKTALGLDDCVERVRDIAEAVKDVIVLCHGGPIATPEDARYVIERVEGVHGFCEWRTPRRRTRLTSEASWSELAGEVACGERDKASDGRVQGYSIATVASSTSLGTTTQNSRETWLESLPESPIWPSFQTAREKNCALELRSSCHCLSCYPDTSPCSSTSTPITLLARIVHSSRTRAWNTPQIQRQSTPASWRRNGRASYVCRRRCCPLPDRSPSPMELS